MKIVLLFVGSFVLLVGNALAMAPGCPCSPCTCSPCHCGGGHHTRIGVGASVDLGGIGRRERDTRDPFAVPAGTSTSQTQEKHKSKSKEPDVVKFNPFTGVKLTGEQAKGVALADSSYRSPGDQSGINLNGTVGAVVPSERKESKSKP